MKLCDMDVYQKIEYLTSNYFYENRMLELLIDYIDEEELEKIVDEVVHDYRISGFEKKGK